MQSTSIPIFLQSIQQTSSFLYYKTITMTHSMFRRINEQKERILESDDIHYFIPIWIEELKAFLEEVIVNNQTLQTEYMQRPLMLLESAISDTKDLANTPFPLRQMNHLWAIKNKVRYATSLFNLYYNYKDYLLNLYL